MAGKRHIISHDSWQARRSSVARGAILAEIHVHLHANRERTRLAQLDQHFHHVDVSHIALAKRIMASGLHQRQHVDRDPGGGDEVGIGKPGAQTCVQSGGTVDVTSTQETGTIFTTRWPR